MSRGGVAAFYEARVRGPVQARAAVLAALAAGEPHVLVRVAELAGGALGLPRSRALRLGLVAETLRAAVRESCLASRRSRLPSRLDRAMRVLVADTLITLTYELAADLPARSGAVARRLLAGSLGADGFLAMLASEQAPEPDPDREASLFLGQALVELGRSNPASAHLEPALASRIRHAASLARGAGPVAFPRADPVPEGLRYALEIWRSIGVARAARDRRPGGDPTRADREGSRASGGSHPEPERRE